MTTTNTNTVNASPLAQSAMLVQLNVSIWVARKYDRKASQEVATNHGAAVSIGNYHKRLLPSDSPSYEKIKSLAREIRTFYYANTLPWSDSGSRILSGSHFQTFADSIRPMINRFESAVKEFVEDYPTLVQNARQELNGLYREEDYPKDITGKFSVSLSMMPISGNTNDFRLYLSENEIKLLEENMKSGIGKAMSSAYERLHDALHSMAESLKTPDKIFRDSLFGNLKELVNILPSLNLTNDPALSAFTESIKEKVLSLSPQCAREDKTARASVAEEAARLAESMKGFFA